MCRMEAMIARRKTTKNEQRLKPEHNFISVTPRPIYSLILEIRIMIVLSSDVAVKDLLDKRSAIYSDRPE
jgi:hypothetical protein